MVEFLEKVLPFSLKLDLVFPHQSLAEEWSFFYVFNRKSKFCLEVVIYSWVVEFLENILAFFLKQDLVYSHQSLAEEWLFFCFFNKKIKVFVAEEDLGLHKRIK